MLNNKYYITIDCAPNGIKPDSVLVDALKNTKMTINNFTLTTKTFGEWIFVLNNDCNANDFIESLPSIKVSLTNSYKKGHIRYAEWYEE
jgi:hypothetical protein